MNTSSHHHSVRQLERLKERLVGYYEEWRTIESEEVQYPSFEAYVLEEETQLAERLEADLIEHLREFDP